jgi:hypothetical protein
MKLAYLKTKLVKKPNNTPIVNDITPSIRNCPKIIKGVNHWNVTDYNCNTVLNKIIETMSFTTPSPKMQLKSFGCLV